MRSVRPRFGKPAATQSTFRPKVSTPSFSSQPKKNVPGRGPLSDPVLLTPGPLTTSLSVKEAVLHDFGSRDQKFMDINKSIRERLLDIAEVTADQYVAVPIQGSGTFAVEAAIGTLTHPTKSKVLVLANGAYGLRMAKICQYLKRKYVLLQKNEDEAINAEEVESILKKDPEITHVGVIQSETTSGIINPVDQIGEVVQKFSKKFIVDAMSSFGVIGLDTKNVNYDAIIASSNKCLEGLPGMAFAITKKSTLEQCQGNSHSLALDLYDQNIQMNQTNQWRFTPPTHVIVSFEQAIQEYLAEGGRKGRNQRYVENCNTLISGMRQLGFKTLIADHLQGPIIVTFHMPADKNFHFQTFYDRLKDKKYVIYPGKLTVAPSFRIGCIGRIFKSDILDALKVIEETLKEMKVTNCGPQ
eukprot:TRINITY_DN2886_c0_g4_i3.p1 TRINITY_DN2886_c0_g4~~TRINITY_DN2886_c0_g4_i3.p1  ORF type:complete len:413 (-),score=127.04 TRINITY_DN2886_c0_g4_i3:64-1302(-)